MSVSSLIHAIQNLTQFKDLRHTYASIPVYERPTRAQDTAIDKLLKLDSWGRPGLRETEFMKLFAECACGLVMTRRVFGDHDCAITVVQNPQTMIDLTLDSDGSDTPHIIDLTVDT